MARARVRRSLPLLLSFAAGVVVTSALVWSWQNAPARLNAKLADDCGEPAADLSAAEDRADRDDRPADISAPTPQPVVKSTRSPDEPPRIVVDPIPDLRSRRLDVPVKGIKAGDLISSFDDERGGGRRHEAIDILAARNTPVLAVEDGIVARLFESKAGGLTVYQFDPTYTYIYYYAHLQRYADGMTGGDRIRRGQVVGYVGTSGNAPPSTPHLHFAIFKLTDKKQWWKGTPIDPFLVLR